MKSPKAPPAPPAPSAATTANSADVAQDAAGLRKKTRDRYDFSKTLLRPGASALPEGMKSTLG